ncbi:MBL fold metallo-hydrolase [Acetobacteraceae bacterium]|nr:MBL fold metallo-hydrolase [Acetobacteraceae bacterium]
MPHRVQQGLENCLEMKILPVTSLRQNCTILFSKEGKALVIDPGGDIAKILKAVDERPIEKILITHGHFDHAGGAAGLVDLIRLVHHQEKLPVIYGPSKEDEFLLNDMQGQGEYCDMDPGDNILPDHWLKDGDIVEFGGHELKVLHIPGHTPGHVVFYDKKSNRLITGDTLFRGTVGRSDFDYCDGEALLKNIREKIFTLPHDTHVFPGHGMPTSVKAEIAENPFFQ